MKILYMDIVPFLNLFQIYPGSSGDVDIVRMIHKSSPKVNIAHGRRIFTHFARRRVGPAKKKRAYWAKNAESEKILKFFQFCSLFLGSENRLYL